MRIRELENQRNKHCILMHIYNMHQTSMRSNLLILKEINSEYSLEELMLKLKLQYLGHMMQRVDSLEKTLML